MIEALRRHLAIARQYVRIGLVRKSQFRMEFVNQVGMDVLFYVTHMATFGIVYGMSESGTLAGWTYPQTLVLLGLVFVHDGFMMTWLGQGWHFGRDLKTGSLDPVRVRPGHPVFLYFFQRFSPEGFVNLMMGASIFAWACWNGGVFGDLRWLFTVPWAVLLAFYGQVLFSVFGSLAEFYFLNSDLGRMFSTGVGHMVERPLDIYSRGLRRFFLFALPAGALSYVPACLVLGRIGPAEGLAYTAFYLAFGAAVSAFWRWSFRRYESAMS